MKLLLTGLSVLAGWALLADLIAGLLMILKPLERIRHTLEQIAMGVRAIEQQTAPLGRHADAVVASFSGANASLSAAAQHLANLDRDLDAAAPALRPGS